MGQAAKRISGIADRNGHLTGHVSFEIQRIAMIADAVTSFRARLGEGLGNKIKQLYGVEPLWIWESPFSIPVAVSGSEMESTTGGRGGIARFAPTRLQLRQKLRGIPFSRRGTVEFHDVVTLIENFDEFAPHEELHVIYGAGKGPMHGSLMAELAAYHAEAPPEKIAGHLLDNIYWQNKLLARGGYPNLHSYSILFSLFMNSVRWAFGDSEKFIQFARETHASVGPLFDENKGIMKLPDGKRMKLDGVSTGFMANWLGLLRKVAEANEYRNEDGKNLARLTEDYVKKCMIAAQPLISDIQGIKDAQSRFGLSDETVSGILSSSRSPEHASGIIATFGPEYAHLEKIRQMPLSPFRKFFRQRRE